MVAILPMIRRAGREARRRWRSLLGAAVLIPSCVVFASWWFTAPLEDVPGESLNTTPIPPTAPATPSRSLAWPEGRLEGREAKLLVLEIVEEAQRRLDRVEGYTATFRKQERVAGKLLPEQTMAMKVRNRPFAIYFKFLTPNPGKEVIYAEGHNGNKVLAHNGDWTRRLVPRLAVDPTSVTAMAENRHPITDAGLSNLARKLVAFRKLDLEDAEAATILDRTTGPDGRSWCRATHTHPSPNPQRPFARVEVLFEPKTLLPLQIVSYDWPFPGDKGESMLAERYAYDDLVLDAPLQAIDFDRTNPAYGFLRY
jgi:hypothetical protein